MLKINLSDLQVSRSKQSTYFPGKSWRQAGDGVAIACNGKDASGLGNHHPFIIVTWFTAKYMTQRGTDNIHYSNCINEKLKIPRQIISHLFLTSWGWYPYLLSLTLGFYGTKLAHTARPWFTFCGGHNWSSREDYFKQTNDT